MKKLFLMIALCMMALGAQAQAKYHTACGTITFRDGHEETYNVVSVPFKSTEKITITPEGGKKTKIPAKDIQSITFWNENFPDIKTTLFCLLTEDKSGKYNVWGVPIMSSNWGVIFRCPDGYGINPKTGECIYYVTLNQSFEQLGKPFLQDWQPLLLQRFDKEIAELVAFIRSYKKGKNKEDVFEYSWPNKSAKNGAKWFEENEEVHQQILDGTLTANDLQYILDQM